MQSVLKPEHIKEGFSIEEEDDHILVLKRRKDVMARFNAGAVPREEIWRVADVILQVERSKYFQGNEDLPGGVIVGNFEIVKVFKKKYEVQNIGIDFYTYDQSFREIRSRYRYKCDECFMCGHKFEDGEKLSMGNIKGEPNKVFCHSCAMKITTGGSDNGKEESGL